jgi:predicted metal-dependent hydrolase
MPQITIGSVVLELQRKSIKNLHISVLPPNGQVRVTAPEKMTDNAVRMAVISRIPWIKKQQLSFVSQPRQSSRDMVSGECHYLWGKRYRLNINHQKGKHHVLLKRSKIELNVSALTSLQNRTALLNDFYRSELKARLAVLIPTWEKRIGVSASHCGVKKMKTKWGSCNAGARRIWLNLELAKKPPECLEFIVVHELVHLLERTHNSRFLALMNRHLPDWRERKDLLNKMPLGHNDWVY